jgi:uncharacterized protein YecT (DUF1311 family)
MKRTILTFSLLLFTVITLTAQEIKKVHPIDKFHRECMDKEENQTTMGMSDCDMQAQEKWDKELNKVYGALTKKLKPEQKEVLKNSQKAWLKHRDEEMKAIDAIFGQLDGSIWMNVRSSCSMKVIKERVLVLQNYLDLLNEVE